MDETPTATNAASVVRRVAAALTDKELADVIERDFRRIADANTAIAVLLAELDRRQASLPPSETR